MYYVYIECMFIAVFILSPFWGATFNASHMEYDDQDTFKMNESESIYGTTLSQESIKVIAESIGVGNFPDEAAKDLAEDVSYRLKEIIQVVSLNYDIVKLHSIS